MLEYICAVQSGPRERQREMRLSSKSSPKMACLKNEHRGRAASKKYGFCRAGELQSREDLRIVNKVKIVLI